MGNLMRSEAQSGLRCCQQDAEKFGGRIEVAGCLRRILVWKEWRMGNVQVRKLQVREVQIDVD